MARALEASAVLARKLPPGVPHRLITRYWARRMTHPNVYYRLRPLPDEYVDAVVAGLRAWDAPASTFLVRAIGEAPTADALRAANKAFYGLDNLPNPYTPKGRATILAVLAHRPYLSAAQATVTAHGWGGDAYGFARALVYDGSNGSVAALRAAVLATQDADRTNLLKFAVRPNGCHEEPVRRARATSLGPVSTEGRANPPPLASQSCQTMEARPAMRAALR